MPPAGMTAIGPAPSWPLLGAVAAETAAALVPLAWALLVAAAGRTVTRRAQWSAAWQNRSAALVGGRAASVPSADADDTGEETELGGPPESPAVYAAIPHTGPTVTAGRRPRGLLGRRRNDRRLRAAVAAGIPDGIDLLAVAVAAGCNVRLAVAAVGRRAPAGPLGDSLRHVDGEVAAGARLAEALERLPDRLGDVVRPLSGALLDAERYGTPLGPTLARLADEARRTRQRTAEEAARRIPVKLLFPLVTCILPAFGMLTVAPLIAGGLRALRL